MHGAQWLIEVVRVVAELEEKNTQVGHRQLLSRINNIIHLRPK